jgi:hypothetical protein
MERVSIIEGNAPAIIVAPHGCDDLNTAIIAEYLAVFTDAYAVINRGWIKSSTVDWSKSKANCNSVPHCHEDVVRDEFLDPLRRYVHQIKKQHFHCYMFVLHGVGNHIRTYVPDLDIIVGVGRGDLYSSISCEDWRKNTLISLMMQTGLHVYEAVENQYAGRGKNNLNQLFRKWYSDSLVHSVQLEIVYELRKKVSTSKALANIMSIPIKNLLSLANPDALMEDDKF